MRSFCYNGGMAVILVTNDDGIDSEGLLVLRSALSSVGEVVVIAPSHNWSATGHSKTMHRSLRADRVALRDGALGYRTDGTPSDCVALGVLGLDGGKPDLVVSGINKGANMGDDITYSGTVSAAMEGTILGIPSIAVSLASRNNFRFEVAAEFAVRVARRILRRGLPNDTLLNINVPNVPEEEVHGVKVTRQGKRIYGDAIVEKRDPRGRKYYWIGGDAQNCQDIPGSDLEAVEQGWISVTPIHLDLTNYAFMRKLRRWKW